MITQDQLESVANKAASMTLSEAAISELRQEFPDIHFTYCQDDDVAVSEPVLESKDFNLYLIDSQNHCLSFTQDMNNATGIVVAEIDEL